MLEKGDITHSLTNVSHFFLQDMQCTTLFYLAAFAVAVHFALDCDTSLYFSSYDNAAQKSFKDQVIWITGASSGAFHVIWCDVM